jgi:transposase
VWGLLEFWHVDAERERLVAENEELRAKSAALSAEVERLTRLLADLKARLDKSSKNSSLPPSSDSPRDRAEATKTRAERRAEAKERRKDELARSRGKQPGSSGQNLSMRPHPDVIVEHEPTNCSSCGEDLAAAAIEGIERRQVFDTPDPMVISTEHRSIAKRCPCGKLNKGPFAREATAPTSYGPNVWAAALYLLHGQHLSVERTAEAMSAMLGAHVSTGFVASLATEAAGGLVGFIDEIRQRLRAAVVVHADERSDQVKTDTWWFHVASNELYTYLFASPTRAKSAPDEAGVLGACKGVMVHDRLAMNFKYDQTSHAICGSHLLREVAAVGLEPDQVGPGRWQRCSPR